MDQAPAAPSAPSSRLEAIDFWRGIVLCMIFVNHVPGNLFELLTYRNIGFSDSAEAFVFLSGMALALAYGRRFADGRWAEGLRALGRRAVRLYGAHLALTAAGLAVFAIGAAAFPDAGLMTPHGRDLVVDDPWAALVGTVSLGLQFGYFNILPMYVVLVLMAPAFLWLGRFGRGPLLLAALALYLVVRLTGLNIPTWPMRGAWFFDPFAWQLVMAAGLVAGLSLRAGDLRLPGWATGVAAAIAVLCLVCATNCFGLCTGLFDACRAWLDLDKTMLGVGRLIHFLAIAYLVAVYRVADRLSATALYKPAVTIGRHGLFSFGLLSLLAAGGQVITQGFGHSPLLDLTVVVAGLGVLYLAAALLDRPALRFAPQAETPLQR